MDFNPHEADRMLDMGFQPALDFIVEKIPEQRQTLLFSATYPEAIQSIARRIMINPVMTKVESTHDNTTIQQHFYKVDDDTHRLTALRLLLSYFSPESTLVFCRTKIETQNLADSLVQNGVSAIALHGDLDQKNREETLVRFSNKSVSVLVAPDVAARGLDIDSLDAVINYHIAHDPEVHVHRIGRTGRAGSKGIACTLFNTSDRQKMTSFDASQGPNIKGERLPPMGFLKKPSLRPSKVTLQIGVRIVTEPNPTLLEITLLKTRHLLILRFPKNGRGNPIFNRCK